MQKCRNRLFLILSLLLFPIMVSGSEIQLSGNTLGAVYFNAQRMFELYSKEMKEIALPANKKKLEEINEKIKTQLKQQDFDLNNQIAKFIEFEKNAIFLPNGPMWLSIDTNYHPILDFKAKIKPAELFGYVQNMLGKFADLTPVKNEKNLVEISFPTPQFNLTMQIKPDGISLYAAQPTSNQRDISNWKEFLNSAGKKETLLDLQVDFNGVKKILAAKKHNGRHSMCFGNLITLKSAIDMYQIDKNKKLTVLDQQELIKEHYLSHENKCSEGGKYSLDSETAVKLVCSIHGSIDKPKEVVIDYEANADPRLRPFQTFRAVLTGSSLILKLQIGDKPTFDQWLAIAKQQLLTIKNMAVNQMGHLPDEEKEKAVEIIDSIKCTADGNWIVLTASGFEEKSVVTGFMGVAAAASSVAMPKLIEARKRARGKACAANRKILGGALVMYNLDHTDQQMRSLDLNVLVKSEYIKNSPKCNEGGEYRFNDQGQIECSKHGL